MDNVKRIALVTGAANGIGLGIARSLAQGGAIVALVDIAAGVHAAAAELQHAGLPAHGFVADASDEASVRDLLADVTAGLGTPDILVNNAGIVIKRDGKRISTLDTTLEEWNRVMAVNVNSVFLLCRACAPAMIERRWGRIINISSLAGRTVSRFAGSNYAASKGAILAFSRIAAAEWAVAGVTVNCVAPGRIISPMNALSADANASALANIPTGRIGDPGDVAATVCFLASEGAAYITGAIIDVNGGAFMG